MPTIAISGADLHYTDAGRGDSVVLVHGSASDYRTWARQIPVFSREFRVVSYSRRYHWPNAPILPHDEYSMLSHVGDLVDVLRSLDAAPAHLVGHSYGAFLALLVAIREPALVRTLVMIEPPAITLFVSSQPKPLELLSLLCSRPRTAVEIVKFGARGVVPATRAFRMGDDEQGIRTFGDAVFGKGGYNRLSADRKAQVADNASNVKAEILGPGFVRLESTSVAAVQQPVMLVDGAQSVKLFARVNDRLEELLPSASRTMIPDAGHMAHEDSPEAFNSVAMSFLSLHRSPA
jgi:pimeloyl-ACP methyl ester carboxylesterase